MWKELLFVGRYLGSSSLNFRVSPDKEASTELSWKKVGRQWMLRSGADKAVGGTVAHTSWVYSATPGNVLCAL